MIGCEDLDWYTSKDGAVTVNHVVLYLARIVTLTIHQVLSPYGVIW